MQLVTKHSDGADEWHCPMCGRRFMMHWPPEYRRVILEPGDESAIHSGGTGGLSISPPSVSEAEASDLSEDLRAVLEEALKDIDFDDSSSSVDS
jgi:hypothetical protein